MITRARHINQRSGGVVIAPWEVDQLDDDWIHALLTELPTMIDDHNKRIAAARSAFFAENLPNKTRH